MRFDRLSAFAAPIVARPSSSARRKARLGAWLVALGLSVGPADAAAPISTATGTAAATGSAAAKGATASSPLKASGEATAGAKPADAMKNSRTVAGFTPEREAEALAFVRTNHPELADLLERLKVRRPHDYEKAIRDLYRVSERLAISEATFPLRYELELKQWKLTSRIQVLSARLSMKRSPEQEQELKHLLAEQLEVHRELVAFNLERSKSRAANLQRELDDLDARKDAILAAKFDKVIKTADQRKPAGKAVAVPEKKDSDHKDSDKNEN